MIRLEKGIEQRHTLFVCPHCEEFEDYSDDDEPEGFECIHISYGGTVKVWLCLKCKNRFYTTFP